MKKMVSLLLLLAMILISGTVIAETSSDTGIWMYCPYMDEFNQPTDEYYVRNEELITGSFSNSSTTDSPLGVWIFVLDGEHVVIRLLEHGSDLVYNSSSNEKTYGVSLYGSDGWNYYEARMDSESNQLIFDTVTNDRIIRTLCENETVSFSVYDDDDKGEYKFEIENTAGLFDMLPCIHTGSFSENLEIVKKAGKYGLMNDSGDLIVPYEYDRIKPFSEGKAAVGEDDWNSFYSEWNVKWGYIDTVGELIIPCNYREAFSFIDERAVVGRKVNGNYEYVQINTEGKILTKSLYTKIVGEFSEGLAVVYDGYNYGYIDTYGRPVIPCRYDEANPFFLGEASVCLNGEYIRIDHNGNTTVSSDRLITMPSW